MIRVAIVGPDGSGKSSVVAEVQRRLGERATVVYMGLNPRSGRSLLPTTRLRDRVRARSESVPAERAPDPASRRQGGGIGSLAPVRAVRSTMRLTNRVAEEAMRHVAARRQQRAGRIVLLDREPLLDYDATDILPDHVSLERRLHGLALMRFPRPDLVVLLDAPAEALYARKGEWSVAYLERRRRDYRTALRHVGRAVVVDATQPLEAVADRVIELIDELVAERSVGPGGERRPGPEPAQAPAHGPAPGRARVAADRARDAGIRVAGGPLGHGLAAVLERMAPWPRDRLAVLTYHRVAPRGERPDLHPGLRSADPRSFREQVSFLARLGTIVDLETVVAAAEGGGRLPERAILITFDDAYADLADHAWPVLHRLGLPAVLFVATGFPDAGAAFWWDRLHAAIELGRRPARLLTPAGEARLDSPDGRSRAFRSLRDRIKAMPHDEALAAVDRLVAELDGPAVPDATLGWDALRRLAGEGLALAPHSRSHPILPNLDADRLREELALPVEDLRREIGSAPPVLAYPSGVHDARVRAATREAGYRLAFTTQRSAVPSLRRADPLALPRINVGGRSTVALIRLQLAPVADRLMVRRRHGDGPGRAGPQPT